MLDGGSIPHLSATIPASIHPTAELLKPFPDQSAEMSTLLVPL